MTPDRWQKIKHLCELALERDPAERAKFLAAACTDDAELHREVESMIARATVGEGILERPIWETMELHLAAAASTTGGAEKAVPASLGRYRLRRLVGEGGMGAVYEAEQEQPRRIVALKVIKPGLVSENLLRRFERESEMLARLQHPAIAQVYEVGTSDTPFGPQPWFAMEFIHGQPLGQYADAHRLNARQRLELIARICDAVEHAHQRGIIHRDLKPANILVEESGQPRILDFGVALATDCDAQATRQTDVGQLIGTLAYMSPEQVLADPLELDTRSDVYALGVILYELLANRLPYEVSNQLHEAVRAIREQDPLRLSSIDRSYRGDVETIVARALEKDKARRYASAAALAEDIRRYLRDEPITARPPSATYQLGKFARRHKALVTATAAVIVALAAGAVISAREAVRARRAEQTAQAVNDFLRNDVLAQASAYVQGGAKTKPDPDLKVRTALDRAAARIRGKFDRQPEVEAAIRDTIGETYMDLGLYPEAQAHFRRARDLYSQALGAENPDTLRAISRLGAIAYTLGKYPEAESLLRTALDGQRRILGFDHPDSLYSLNNLAITYASEGKYAEAEPLQRQTLEIRRRVLGATNAGTLAAMHNLANLYYAQGKYAEAAKVGQQTVEIQRRVLGPEHPGTLSSMTNLANAYDSEGKHTEAEALYRQTLDAQRRVLGNEHPDTLRTMANLATVYAEDGRYAQAEPLQKQTLESQRRVLGAEHPETLMSMGSLSIIYTMEGRYAAAESLLMQALEAERRQAGPEHPNTLNYMDNLANVFGLEGKFEQAEQLFGATLATSARVLGKEHPATLAFVASCAIMYQREGKYALAETWAARALAGRRHALGSDNPDTIASATDLALAYISQGKFAESEPPAREAVTFFRSRQPDDWDRFRAESLLGASLAGQKKYAEAEPLALEGYQGMLARKAQTAVPDLPQLERACNWLVQLYEAWGKPEKAAAWKK